MAKRGSILLNLAGIGPSKVKKIIERISDIDNIFKLKKPDLTAFSFLNQKDIQNIILLRKSKRLDSELKLIDKKRIEVVDIFDSTYPYLLRQISSPPLVLYIKGNVEILDGFSVAIVGTRKPTDYGKSVAFDFSYKLSSLGLNIVSGLAKGIDTAAHQGAVGARQKTVAVLGSGLGYIYPRQNKKLAQEITETGAIISEYPVNTSPLPCNFPRRNRIISGLSKGVLVVEAAEKSGALITANFAVGQNREVFAVCGRINQFQSKGPNSLIKEGAKLTDSVEDILEEINLSIIKPKGSRFKVKG